MSRWPTYRVVVSNPSDELEREWAFFNQVIDPLVREVLALDDAWAAYRRANEMYDLLSDPSPGGSWEFPHSGSVYVAWAELTDLFETGKTPIQEAHAALRLAAKRWLDRPAGPNARFIEQWVSDVSEATGTLFERDGDWWRDPR